MCKKRDTSSDHLPLYLPTKWSGRTQTLTSPRHGVHHAGWYECYHVSLARCCNYCFLSNQLITISRAQWCYPNQMTYAQCGALISTSQSVRLHCLCPCLSKLAPCTKKWVFVGYPLNQKGYRVYFPSTRCYIISADVTFHEDVPLFSPSSLIPILISISTSTNSDPLLVHISLSSLPKASSPTFDPPPFHNPLLPLH